MSLNTPSTAHSIHMDMPEDTAITLGDIAASISGHYKQIVGGSLVAGLLALGITYLIPPTYTATAVLIPPQQQGSAAMALSSLGALASLAGGSGGLKNPAEQYLSMLQSTTIRNKLIDEFNLLEIYDVDYKEDARKKMAENIRITVGKKDGLISIEVDDKDAKRSAAMANSHVVALRDLTEKLALSEAQQRRHFFENQLEKTRSNLTAAQTALQESGFSEGALNADPKAAAERYAAVSAQITSTTVELQLLRTTLSDQSPEVIKQQSTLAALKKQLQSFESPSVKSGTADYISKYRNFKYHETLFEMLANQYELARVDEAREGALIQVIDEATAPERKSKPKRGLISAMASVIFFIVLSGFFIFTRTRKNNRFSHV